MPRRLGSKEMDRTVLLRRWEQAESHIAVGERHIARQRQIIAMLEGNGLDARHARSSLTLFEEMQVLHIANRDRLVEALQNAELWEEAQQKFG